MFSLFYPKEMKALIKQLELSGELNNRPIISWNLAIGILIGLGALSSSAMLIDGHYISALVLFCVPALLAKWLMHSAYWHGTLPYIENNQSTAKVVKETYSSWEGKMTVHCLLPNGESLRFYEPVKWKYSEFSPAGTRLKVFLNSRDKGYGLPNVDKRNSKYCLSQKIVDENKHHTMDNILKQNESLEKYEETVE